MNILRPILEYIIIPFILGAFFTWLYFKVFPKRVGKIWGWGKLIGYSFLVWVVYGFAIGIVSGGIFINQPELFFYAWFLIGLPPIILSPILVILFLIVITIGVLITERKIKIVLFTGVFWGTVGTLFISGIYLHFFSDFIVDVVVSPYFFPVYVLIHTLFASIASAYTYKTLLKNAKKI